MIIKLVYFVLILISSSLGLAFGTKTFKTSTPRTTTAFPSSQILGGSCSQPSDCSPAHTVCGFEKCRCQLGYLPAANGIDCVRFPCDQFPANISHLKCQIEFHDENVYCNYRNCTCTSSFQEVYNSQKCVPKYPAIGQQCLGGLCGAGATCAKPTADSPTSRCMCYIGRKPSKDGITCEPFQCNYDSDCYQWGAYDVGNLMHSVYCDIRDDARQCLCADGYEVNWWDAGVKCQAVKPTRARLIWGFVMSSLGSFVFGGLIVGGLIYAYCKSGKRIRDFDSTNPVFVISNPGQKCELKVNLLNNLQH